MENIKNFIGNVMVAGGRTTNTAFTSNNEKSINSNNVNNYHSGAMNYNKSTVRNRTESESSNASLSSLSSIDNGTHYGRPVAQKDKDSYFWVM